MGGKDAIVVDADCDLDRAVEGVAVSAFGYSGQKCSACSRAIVDAKVYDAFLEKLQARVSKITVGAAEKPENYMGPVISDAARRTILQYIETGKQEGRLLPVSVAPHAGGAYLGIVTTRPAWMLAMWGQEISWDFMQTMSLWFIGVFKLVMWFLFRAVLWLTLWARQLRKLDQQGTK